MKSLGVPAEVVLAQQVGGGGEGRGAKDSADNINKVTLGEGAPKGGEGGGKAVEVPKDEERGTIRGEGNLLKDGGKELVSGGELGRVSLAISTTVQIEDVNDRGTVIGGSEMLHPPTGRVSDKGGGDRGAVMHGPET